MALAAKLFTDPPADRRVDARRPVGQGSTLRADSSGPVDVLVHDLSVDGFSIETSLPLSIDATVSLGMPGVGVRHAAIVRKDGNVYGGRFDIPLTQADVLCAFETESVIHGPFSGPFKAEVSAEPVIEKWHPALRAALIVGSASALWSALLRIF